MQTSAGGAITRIEIASGVFVASAISIPFDDATEMAFMPPVGGVQLTFTNAAGAFTRVATATGEPLRGVMPLAGVQKFCIFFVACGAMPSANVSVPLSVVGEGGVTTAAFLPSVTVEGAPWSTGTVTVDGTGSATAMISGTVQPGSESTLVRLVTPVFLSTNTTGTVPTTRGVGVLTFVLKPAPEPALAAALAMGVATLSGIGWHRARVRKSRAHRSGMTS